MEGFRAAADESIVELLFSTSLTPQGGVIVSGSAGACEYRWGEVAELACRAADGLARRGISTGERVAVAAENSLEWIVADLAIQILGGVVVPLHVSLTGSQLAWQLAHSGSQLLIATPTIVGKLTNGASENAASALKIVSLAAAPDPCTGEALPLWSELMAEGNAAAGRERWESTRRSVTPQTLASIVYTSGTSGEPRGVMLTHGNLAANAVNTLPAFGSDPHDCRLNALPFSHAFGRMSDLYVSLAANTHLALGRSRETLLADAQLVRPTLMVVVPLLLARLRQAAIAQFGPAEKTAVQKLLGGRLRAFICGGATLAEDVREYFAAQGTPVCEGYGLTEAAPVVSASPERNGSKPNSVGLLLPKTEARTADDGELLIRGPQVMAGYWQDAAATAEVLRDGWLHTGDLGSVDQDGFLFLRGRKKEFIALASGKKIWPAAIEGRFAGDPLIEQIMLVGEGERALGALIVPRQRDETAFNSAENRQRFLDHLSHQQADAPTHELVRSVWLLAEPWTAEREELTPKLTLRRSVILRNYAESVRRMFAGE